LVDKPKGAIMPDSYDAELIVEFIGDSDRLEELRDDIENLINNSYKDVDVKGL
jgi:hypothetical protein